MKKWRGKEFGIMHTISSYYFALLSENVILRYKGVHVYPVFFIAAGV
jgi:hypothetical protein